MNEVYLYDEKLTTKGLLPFALTDYFIEWVQEVETPLLHFWQLEDTFILGMKDMRVPYLKDGLETLNKTTYQAILRSAGGLGVINDPGVLNVSLFLPNFNQQFSIDDAYKEMTMLIQSAFSDLSFSIEAYEIPTSYCPGKFDLSIQGKKIAGIAQRRLKSGIAVMLYLSVSGDQLYRGECVKDFYQAALKEDFGKNGYPAVDPAIMANISEFSSLTLEEAKNRMKRAFSLIQNAPLNETFISEKLKEKEVQLFLQQKYKKMLERNNQIQEIERSLSENDQ